MNALVSCGLFLTVGLLFTAVDAWLYPKTQAGKLNLILYRAIQLALQFGIYAVLWFTHHTGALAAFAVTHWTFGWDWFYYVLRGEDFLDYTITWFAMSLPSIVFRAIHKS